MKSKMFLMFLVLVVMSSTAFADLMLWNNYGGNSDWSTAAHWYNNNLGTYGALPGAADSVWTGQGGTVTVDIAATVAEVQLGAWSGNGGLDVQEALSVTGVLYGGVANASTLDLNSASGSITGVIYLGHSADLAMTMSAGVINSSAFYAGTYAGTTTVDMSNGVINAGQFYIGDQVGAIGNVNLSGGSIITDWLGVGQNGGIGLLTLSGDGKLVIGNAHDTPAAWLDVVNDMMGTSILNAQANIVGDTVEITAVPEPATMLLLGLGGVLLRRKRA